MKLICETDQEYFTYLLGMIDHHKQMITTYQELSKKWPNLTEELGELILFEKKQLTSYQNALPH